MWIQAFQRLDLIICSFRWYLYAHGIDMHISGKVVETLLVTITNDFIFTRIFLLTQCYED